VRGKTDRVIDNTLTKYSKAIYRSSKASTDGPRRA